MKNILRKSIIYLFVSILCLTVSGVNSSSNASKLWEVYPANPTNDGIYDADKYLWNLTGEAYLCWAASASNVLAWGGWAGINNNPVWEDHVFQWFKNQGTKNAGLNAGAAWDYYITGRDPNNFFSADWGGYLGGTNQAAKNAMFDNLYYSYWSDGIGDLEGDYFRSYVNADSHGLLDMVGELYNHGYGVSIGPIINSTGTGHALTLWGYDNNYLWMTDSDSDMFNPFILDPTWIPDTMDKVQYQVATDSTSIKFEKSGVDFTLSALEIYGLKAHPSWFPDSDPTPWLIDEDPPPPPLPDPPPPLPPPSSVPEPTTILLFGLGLLGLAGGSRKKHRY